eukprot:2087751-Prymnesium_polylepis.1
MQWRAADPPHPDSDGERGGTSLPLCRFSGGDLVQAFGPPRRPFVRPSSGSAHHRAMMLQWPRTRARCGIQASSVRRPRWGGRRQRARGVRHICGLRKNVLDMFCVVVQAARCR